jgi:hypothetical protein
MPWVIESISRAVVVQVLLSTSLLRDRDSIRRRLELASPPGTAEYQPAFDIQLLSQLFDIGNKMSGRICGEIDTSFAGVWTASSAVTLVKQTTR